MGFWKLSIAIAGCCALSVADAFTMNPSTKAKAVASPTHLFSSATTCGTAPVLKSLLKKPTKVLTIGVEYSSEEPEDQEGGSLELLSMKLRSQAKVSFIVCSDLPTIKELSAEQESARGNFPGPVPIVFEGSALSEDVSGAGASAVVVDAAADDAVSVAEAASSAGLETVWKVSTAEQTKQVLESTDELADVFLLDVRSDDDDGVAMVSRIIEALPKSSMSIATLHDPMQEDGAEIETGKEFKSMGCASVFVRKACVGDKEDIDYASFVVGGLTSKASKEFKFSGLTGSTNGHFGGIQSNSSVKWERTRVLSEEKDEGDDE